MTELQKVSIIGAGKVGRALGRALKNAGYQIGIVTSSTQKNANEAVDFIGAGIAETDPVTALASGAIHLITIRDDYIPVLVRDLDARGPESLKDHYFFHTNGTFPSTVLEPLAAKGAEIGSIHPLQVFADPGRAVESLPGSYYALEGTDRAMTLALQLVARLQGKFLLIPTGRKVLYHVAGVFAANYLTVLVNLVLHIMEEIGETPEEAYQAFLPLMVGALENIEELGVSGALTGPVSRGDSETILRHLDALQELRPEIEVLYRLMGLEALDIAVHGGKVSIDRARELALLMEPKGTD